MSNVSITQSSEHRAPDSARLRIAIVTGIYPPDIGGPASHAAAFVDVFRARGHHVTVVTFTDEHDPVITHDLVALPRRWPWPRRQGAVAVHLLRSRHKFDIIYAAGLHLPAVLAGRVSRRAVVTKVVGDPAWERSARLSLTTQSFEQFQQGSGGSLQERAMRFVRDWSTRHASAIVVPSNYLRDVVRGWVGDGVPIQVIRNGVRTEAKTPRCGASRRRTGALRVAYVGRLVPHKRVDVLIRAVAETAFVELEVVGTGPELGRLQALARSLHAPVDFVGARPHDEVLDRLANMDVLANASSYEGLPHVVLEALTLGVPVVTSAAGGTDEAVTDGLEGLAVDPPDATHFARAFTQLRHDKELLSKLSRGAQEAAPRWTFDRSADQLEGLMRSLGDRGPRVAFLSRTALPRQLTPDLRMKLELLTRHVHPVLIGRGPAGTAAYESARLIRLPDVPGLGAPLFHAVAPAIALAWARGPGATIVCQSPYEAVALLLLRTTLRRRPRVVVEIHGDWRLATRQYGRRARKLVAPLADRLATFALRRADGARAVSAFTEQLIREAGFAGSIDRFPAFSDYAAFTDKPVIPPPENPVALYVGSLEMSKGPDVLVAAFRQVLASVPTAQLHLAGSGRLRATLERQVAAAGMAAHVTFHGQVCRRELVTLIDAATCVVAPSRSEGLGRALLEAMARGRPVVGSRTGGIAELVLDGATGMLVTPADPDALAQALCALLSTPSLATRMGQAARRRVLDLDPTRAFEAGIARLRAAPSA